MQRVPLEAQRNRNIASEDSGQLISSRPPLRAAKQERILAFWPIGPLIDVRRARRLCPTRALLRVTICLHSAKCPAATAAAGLRLSHFAHSCPAHRSAPSQLSQAHTCTIVTWPRDRTKTSGHLFFSSSWRAISRLSLASSRAAESVGQTTPSGQQVPITCCRRSGTYTRLHSTAALQAIRFK